MNITPGPWKVYGFDGCFQRVRDKKGYEIAGLIRSKADANAISLLPEMVELIKEFVPVMPIDEEVVQEQYIKLSKRASALLRRIEGEEETDEL